MRFEYKDSFSLFHLQNTVCEGSILAVRRKNYMLRPLAADNINFLMVTSEMITDCASVNWVGCPPQATYCVFIPVDNLVDMINDREYLLRQAPCVEELFFYLFPKNVNEPALVVLYSDKSPKPCMDVELDFCAAQTFEDCRTEGFANCAKVECFALGHQQRGLCMANVTEEKAYNTCNTEAVWALDANHDFNIEILEPPNGFSAGVILLAIVLFGLLSTCCCSIYYRYRLKTDGFAPFSPPTYCPEFLFPLPEYLEADYASINNGMVPLRILRNSD